MSSKPATPGAAGAPRLLLYVAEPRQPDAPAPPPPPPAAPPPTAPPALYLDSSQHLQRHALYSNIHHIDPTHNNTIYYKPAAEDKFTVCATDNIHQRHELYPMQRTFYKDCIKVDGKVGNESVELLIKQDQPITGEFANVETFHNRIPAESSEIYQNQCSSYVTDCIASMQPIVIRQNQYNENVHSVNEQNSDKESVRKSIVNYQLLEQSVTHQSIVNQSISILNQQIGVNRGVNSEVEGGQLVRTAEGVVLAVLPHSKTSQLTQEVPDPRTISNEVLQPVTVPLGWKRITSGASVIYISPSGTALSTLLQLREYLQTTGTCKCGLPCPLRPEIAFSFDPKVPSKPYQPPTSGELTRLCNHKRKLLATLSARAQQPASPPPHEHKKGVGEITVVKKRMKKRPGLSGMAAPQLVVHKERSSNEFKQQDSVDSCRSSPPELNVQRKFQPSCVPYPGVQQNISNVQDIDSKLEPAVQRGSHYLTVNSGWIQQESIDAKNSANSTTTLNVGVPILGNNGQIIGVNTGYNKNIKHLSATQHHIIEEPKEVKRDLNTINKHKAEEPQIYCGLNQPLTPEVMQKINEQQQLFIQQNQKQIEMAMKGYKTQHENTNKSNCPNQFVPQGQLIIQNGAVVKANPAKTPPWQVKRLDSNSMTSPSPNSHKSDNMDYDESNTNFSEESTSSNNSFQSNESLNQGMCSRVPPLPQHYNMTGQQWHVVDASKKKPKTPKSAKKKASPIENKAFSANGLLQDFKGKLCDDIPTKNVPSFMDDPNGFLARQTVLLNNTISKQVGINSNFDGGQFDRPNCFTSQIQGEKPKVQNKPVEVQNVYRNKAVLNPLSSPNIVPDSSVVSERIMEPTPNCCQGCNVPSKTGNDVYVDNKYRRNYVRQGLFNKMEMENALTSPQHNQEESPVTSSMFAERSGAMLDMCGPIQAGTVSTSHVSPAEASPSGSSRGASPAPPGPQAMHFISNHNVNKNLMEVDNIAMVGVRPGATGGRAALAGYWPPPHLGGRPAATGGARLDVTTMASGWSVTRDTMTSVLAGRAPTATTSVTSARPPPAPAPASASPAIPNNHPDPFLHAVNLPTSYPLHIAGTTAQNMISKSPLEMIQNVIGGSPSTSDNNNVATSCAPTIVRRSSANPGQILISSTGQILVSNSAMPPPPPKTTTVHSPNQLSTNVNSSVLSQQQAVVMNALPPPFVLQPSLMVDGQVVPQNLQQLVGQVDAKSGGCVQGFTTLSPESVRKKKKKKSHGSVTSVLHISAAASTRAQASPPQQSPPLLQALTLLPKPAAAAAHHHILMNAQPNNNTFPHQQILSNTSPSHQINLLQPVNLINNASQVVSNFPAFQQFIVPNLGGMVMAADGTTIIQENAAGVPMQLQIQTVNGQNVLTHMPNPGVFTAGANGGVVLRTQNQQGKIIQSQHSPGAQFLSPNSQVIMNSPNFNGQLSPLLANLSPTNMTFNTSPPQLRSGNVQAQEFIHTNQLGQTLMVPLSPKSIGSTSTNRSNSTFVHQNTTIVQQQTTLVSNAHNNHSTANLQNSNTSRLSIDPNVLIKSAHNQISHQMKSRNMIEMAEAENNDNKMNYTRQAESSARLDGGVEFGQGVCEYGVRQSSVSTQTRVGAAAAAAAALVPDTTTHSPPAPRRATPAPRRATPAPLADTTTSSPDPNDHNASAMVQCVSSSEQDVSEATPRDTDDHGLLPNVEMLRQTRATLNTEDTNEIQYNHHSMMSQNINHQQNMMPVAQHYYERSQAYKRKSEFEQPSYRAEKMMRSSYSMSHGPIDSDSDLNQDKSPRRHYSHSGPSTDSANIQRMYERHNLGAGHDTDRESTEAIDENPSTSERSIKKFERGDLVWGPVKGYASWPGKLVERAEDGWWTVRWFGGDKAPGRVAHDRLLTLSEGLEAHHAARTKHRKSRKLNTHLENAIQEAMAELDKKSEAKADTETSAEEPSCSTETPKRKRTGKDKRKGKIGKFTSKGLRSAR